MEPSIFTRIINGELPSHKIYEDDHTLAFLSIHPTVPGHTLVVSKVQIANLHELNDEEYTALFTSVKKVMNRMTTVFGSDYRVCLKVAGFDIPHVHIHVIACRTPDDFHAKENMATKPDHVVLSDIAQRLAF